MPVPIYDPESLSALARVLAEAALAQLIADSISEGGPGEQADDQRRLPVTDVEAGARVSGAAAV